MALDAPQWRFKELIIWLGDIEGVQDLLKNQCDIAPGYDTVKGWKFRNSIPSAYLPILIEAAIEKGDFSFKSLRARDHKRGYARKGRNV